jgi:poly(3-hydroxybutyrate) depolymerase
VPSARIERAAAAARRRLGAFLLTLCAALPAAGQLPPGKAVREADLEGTRIMLFTYRPAIYAGGPLVVVFHGSERRPGAARDNLVALADRVGALVVAPYLDAERFPRWAYHLGGIVEPTKLGPEWRERPPEAWTGQLVLRLVAFVRGEEGDARLPYYLVGHSAGAQFLGRFAAFVPNEARRIVLANAGSFLRPSATASFPYGFAGLPGASGERVCAYLARPITILVGQEDVLVERLDRRPGAQRQGANRYERARNVFAEASALAAKQQRVFNWRMVEVPGVGHDSRALYGAPELAAALFGGGDPQPPRC